MTRRSGRRTREPGCGEPRIYSGQQRARTEIASDGVRPLTARWALANASRASASQEPQQSLQPVRSWSCANDCTPPATSRRMSASVTALQLQMYMARIRTQMRTIVNTSKATGFRGGQNGARSAFRGGRGSRARRLAPQLHAEELLDQGREVAQRAFVHVA